MRLPHTSSALVALLASAIIAYPVAVLATGDTARNTSATTTKTNTTTAGKDDAFVTLTGTVGAITEKDAFQLKYGQGTIRVDTNDGRSNVFHAAGRDAGKVLREGERVTVTGHVDENWFTKREIDAKSIRTSNGQTYSRDTNWLKDNNWATDNVNEDRIRLTGIITEVINDSRYRMRFSAEPGTVPGQKQGGTIEIDTTGITGGKNQAFKAGDRVTVVGELDDTFFRGREINVETIQYANQGTPKEASPAAGPGTRSNY